MVCRMCFSAQNQSLTPIPFIIKHKTLHKAEDFLYRMARFSGLCFFTSFAQLQQEAFRMSSIGILEDYECVKCGWSHGWFFKECNFGKTKLSKVFSCSVCPWKKLISCPKLTQGDHLSSCGSRLGCNWDMVLDSLIPVDQGFCVIIWSPSVAYC